MNKSSKRNIIIALSLTLIFSFFFGYYLCYRINVNRPKSKLEIIQDIMENEWYYGIDDEDIKSTLEEKMILGMLDLNTDPFTRYLTSLGTLADSYTGLGVSVQLYGPYFVVSEVTSKQAIDDGIKVGDVIVSVNETNVANKSLDELSNLILANEQVSLKIARNNDYENLITINSKITSYNPVRVFTKEYDNVAYVKISEFNLDTGSCLDEYFASLSSQYVNLVLDLRGNPGGYISAVRDVLDLFLPSERIVMTTVDKYGNATQIKTIDDDAYIFNKIMVLIDENSASGAEALSAAIDYHLDNIVTLYGNTTYGKGSAQKTYYFEDGTYFHYTYALWNTPEGVTIHHRGVTPEVFDVNEGISSLEISQQTLDLYDYGEDVLNVQKLLKMLDYYHGELHSFMDVETCNALKEFQRDNSLEESGVVDNATLRLISKLIYDDKVNFENEQLNEVLEMFA